MTFEPRVLSFSSCLSDLSEVCTTLEVSNHFHILQLMLDKQADYHS